MILARLSQAFKVFFRKKQKGNRSTVAELTCSDSDRLIIINMVQVDGDADSGGIVVDFEILGGVGQTYDKMTAGEKLQYEFLGIMLDGLKKKY